MRYHYQKPKLYSKVFGELYLCNHPVYNRCTLFKVNNLGLAVIQQKFDKDTKQTWWEEIDEWIANDIYLNAGFLEYFYGRAKPIQDGLYPTVTVRQIMWALKMKPIKKEQWETCFDRRDI